MFTWATVIDGERKNSVPSTCVHINDIFTAVSSFRSARFIVDGGPISLHAVLNYWPKIQYLFIYTTWYRKQRTQKYEKYWLTIDYLYCIYKLDSTSDKTNLILFSRNSTHFLSKEKFCFHGCIYIWHWSSN